MSLCPTQRPLLVLLLLHLGGGVLPGRIVDALVLLLLSRDPQYSQARRSSLVLVGRHRVERGVSFIHSLAIRRYIFVGRLNYEEGSMECWGKGLHD